MARRPRLAAKARNGDDDMKGYQATLNPVAMPVAGPQRKRPSAWRILLVGCTSAEMWMPIILGLLFAGVLRLLP
jgi:hypothetical protein